MGEPAVAFLNSLQFPLREQRSRARTTAAFTPTIDALVTPDIDASLDEQADEDAFLERVQGRRRLVGITSSLLAPPPNPGIRRTRGLCPRLVHRRAASPPRRPLVVDRHRVDARHAGDASSRLSRAPVVVTPRRHRLRAVCALLALVFSLLDWGLARISRSSGQRSSRAGRSSASSSSSRGSSSSHA